MASTLVSALERLATEKPDKPAYIFLDKNWKRTVFSRRDVWDLSRKFAALLRRKNIGHGDTVCNTLPNSPERLITQLGTVLAGAIDMNGQICLADGADFVFSLNQGRAKAVIMDPTDQQGAAAILKAKRNESVSSPTQSSYLCPEIPTLQLIIPCIFEGRNPKNEQTLMDEISNEDGKFSTYIELGDICSYMCTSGSTGFFKLVPFTSRNLLEYTRVFGHSMKLMEDSIYCNDRPLGWLGGYPVMYPGLGCTRVLVDCALGRPDSYANFLWEMFDREECTHTYTVPLALENLIRAAYEHPHTSGHKLKVCGCGSGPLTKRHMQAIGILAEDLRILYASTEGGAVATMRVTNPDDFVDLTCGWPTLDCEIKIVDKELTELPANTQGEIIFRNSQCVSHYVNNEVSTEETFLPGGWVKLGDIGVKDKTGLLSVIGRNKFAILRGPFIVYPDQLEIRIKQCPGISDVVITAVPDEKLYEEICALIIAEPKSSINAEAVRNYCQRSLFLNTKNTELNPLPKHYLFVTSFPTLSSGKLDRSAAKVMARKLLNQQS